MTDRQIDGVQNLVRPPRDGRIINGDRNTWDCGQREARPRLTPVITQ